MTGQQIFLAFGALFGFIGVATGAFGAHLLRSRLSIEFLNTFEVGVRYQLYHAFALIGVALLMHLFPSSWFLTAGWLFMIGTLIFSGSLYILVLTGVKSWGAVTPVGGLLLLAGWFSLFLGSFFIRS